MTPVRTNGHPALTTLGVVGAAGLAATVWGFGIERYLFTLRRHVVPILEPGTKALRILHLSDAHMAPWQHRKQRWIAALREYEPDFIVNTGDNMGHVDGLRGLRAAYDAFEGIPGVFVHGSNDMDAPSPRNPFKYFMGPSRIVHKSPPLDTAALDNYLEDLGWRGVDNDATSFEVKGHRVNVMGAGDAHRDWDRLDLLPGLADRLREADTDPDGDGFADVPADPHPLTFGVAHAPYRRVLDAFTGLGADMLFAGHTHGGQVRIPFVGALVANCDIPLRQARGLSEWTHSRRTIPLNVSAGLGHSIYAPVRFSCPPEASLIDLVPRSAS
jgi:uncharacterized protein